MRYALLLAALVATPALAAPAPSWAFNKAKSRLGFVASMNGQAINGAFRRFDARIQFDPANLPGSSVAATIDTGSAFTGEASRDQSLPTSDWFNIKAFPQAEFKSSQFKKVGPDRYIAQGNLTIRGISRPVALPFQLAIKDKLAVMRGSLTIDRRAFCVGQGQFAGTEAVAAHVRVDVTIEATR